MVLFGKILYNILLIISLAFFIPVALVRKKWRKNVLSQLRLKSQLAPIRKKGWQKSERKSIWVHAVSVGEIIAVVPLVKKMKDHFKNHDIVLSTATQTGFAIAHNLLAEYVAAVFYFPFDVPIYVKHAITKIEPEFVIVVEHDIWPNFLFELKYRNIPAILVNARLSKKTFSRRRRVSFFMKFVFATFSKVCAQSIVDAERFKLLGVSSEKIVIVGNLKFDQAHDAMSEEESKQLRQTLNIRTSQKVLVAGSTHKGEEVILSEVLIKLKQEFSELICIVVPRDPKRAEVVCRIFKSAGFSAVLMKEMDRIKDGNRFDVIVIDVLGILKRLYAISDITFIGGSLVKRGGHNPIEAAAYAKPILFGPNMSNFDHISHLLERSGGAIRIQDTESFYETAVMLLKDTDNAQKIGENAFNVYWDNKGAVEKTLHSIKGCLKQNNL